MARIKKLAADRDKAMIKAVVEDDWSSVHKYCKKYGVYEPEHAVVLKAGIYKAVQACTKIPVDVKDMAAEKCRAIGFDPMLHWRGNNG